jgi:hypothetical protein
MRKKVKREETDNGHREFKSYIKNTEMQQNCKYNI